VDKNSILVDLSESDKTRFCKEPFASQSTPQKVFLAVWDVMVRAAQCSGPISLDLSFDAKSKPGGDNETQSLDQRLV
jgi:hypothetical protein